MQDHRLNGGKWLSESLKKNMEQILHDKLGATAPVVQDILDYRIFLDHKGIADQGLSLQRVKDCLREYLQTTDNACFVADYEHVMQQSLPPVLRDRLLMGYHPRRSGDLIVVPEPGYYDFGTWSSPTGTTHGEWNPYDAHIPLLFYGWKVPHGETSREVHITDIAPTICQMLHIQQPNACVGEAIGINER